jgi:hypothetical protein
MIADYVKFSKNPLAAIRITALCLMIGLALSGCSEQGVKPDIANHLVVMVDASGSYKTRQAEAVEKAVAILEGMSKTKLKRWESASDKIFIISLDASPDTIWQGSLKELKGKDPSFWKERFISRNDYEGCTDVSSAFHLAARHLAGNSRYVSKYLFVFSDLIHEPPTVNMRACQFPVKVSPEGFPWANLEDVSVSVFWIPPDQKLMWRKAVQERGMEANFSLYTTSESATVSIQNPPRPQEKVTEADLKARRGQIKSTVMSGISWAVIITVAFILLIIVGFMFQRNRDRRRAPVSRSPVRVMPNPQRPGGRPIPPAGRPVPGPRPSVISQKHRP